MRIFIPASISSHPYLKLLYGGLGVESDIKIYDLKRPIDLLKILEADIIHIHWIENYIRSPDSCVKTVFRFIFFLLLILFLKIFGKKTIITLHNVEPHERFYPRIEKLGFSLYIKIIADAIIVHNRWAKKEVKELYKINLEKVHIIPHGNFIGYYENEITKSEARSKLRIPKNAYVILYFGKIKRYKGLNNLFQVLNELENENFWVLICGKLEEKALRNELLNFKQNFSNCILKLEYISDDEIQIYMNAADIGIIPYEKITTSGTLLLFASFKRTVIVPNLKSIEDTIGNAAIYYNHGDLKDLKRAIIWSKNRNSDKLSKRIFKKVLEYNWKNIVMKTYQLYQRTVRC